MLVVMLHVFTSRTGQVALYAGLGAALVWWVLRYRRWKLAAAGLLAGLLVPLLAYWALPSLQDRVRITVEDVHNLQQGGELTKWSLGRRYAVYVCAWDVFTAHPLAGVGLAQHRDSILARYDGQPFVVAPTARLPDPHNQWLEVLSGSGLLGLLVLTGWFAVPFVAAPGRKQYLLWAFGAVVLVGTLFESVLERQVGLNFVVFGLWLLAGMKNEE
jgi:O-antigen ligase